MATAATEVKEEIAAEQNDQAPIQPSAPKLPTCVLCDEATAVVQCATCDKRLCDNHGKEHQLHISDHKLVPIKQELTDRKTIGPNMPEGAKTNDSAGEKEKDSCDECGTKRMKKEDGSYLQFCAGCALDFHAPKTEPEIVILDFEILSVDRLTECGFCYARLEEIQEPKALPCGHTNCAECINVNFQNKEIECKICKIVFSEINILALPKVSAEIVSSALAEPVVWIPIHLRCELCTPDTVRAAVCCADCKRRLCRKHADEHTIHIPDHVMLPIEDELAPERYEVMRCQIPTHANHVLDEICIHCKNLFCKRCDTKKTCPALNQSNDDGRNTVSDQEEAKTQREDQTGSPHEVVPLKQVTDDMRRKLREFSQDIHSMIKKCRDVEKSSWKRLGSLEEHVKGIYRRIDWLADDLYLQIKRQVEAMKTEYAEHLDVSSADVNQFSEDILLNITVLDDLFIYSTNLADRRPDKQLLEEFGEVTEEIEQTKKNEKFKKSVVLRTPYFHHTEPDTVNIEAEMKFLPKKLEHMKTETTPGFCYGVSWTEDERILCAMSEKN